MNEFVNPTTIGAPAAAYSLGVVSSADSLWLHTSGIVATLPDGTIPDTVTEQAAVIWHAIGEICAASGFTIADIVSYTTYVVQGEDLSIVMAARDAALVGHAAASTLIVVPALARPQWRMEIAAIAARTSTA